MDMQIKEGFWLISFKPKSQTSTILQDRAKMHEFGSVNQSDPIANK